MVYTPDVQARGVLTASRGLFGPADHAMCLTCPNSGLGEPRGHLKVLFDYERLVYCCTLPANWTLSFISDTHFTELCKYGDPMRNDYQNENRVEILYRKTCLEDLHPCSHADLLGNYSSGPNFRLKRDPRKCPTLGLRSCPPFPPFGVA